MSWTPGEKLSVARLNRLTSSIPTSYTVFKDGSTYYAECNLPGGGTPYSGTNASTVIQSAMDALTGGRTWKEKVTLKGDFVLTAPLAIPNYTVLEVQGELSVATDIDAIDILGTAAARKVMVEVNGARILANPTAANSKGINMQYADWVTIDRVDVQGFSVGIDLFWCWVNDSIYRSRLVSNIDYNVRLIQTNDLSIISGRMGDQTNAAGAGLLIDSKSGMNNIFGNTIEGNVGYGIVVANSHDNLIQGNYFELNFRIAYTETYTDGLENYVGMNRILNNYFDSNDVGVGTREKQIYLHKSLGNLIEGNSFVNGGGLTYSVAAIQLESGAEDTVIAKNRHDAGGGTQAFISDAGTRTKYHLNPTFVTRSSGSATILNTATSTGNIAHGLAGTPTVVFAFGSTTDTEDLYCSSKDATNIVIDCVGAVGGDRTIYWTAEYKP